MLKDNNELLTDIGTAIVSSAPTDWSQLTVKAMGMGASVDLDAFSHAEDGTETQFWLGAKGITFLKLRRAMYKPSTGTWYIARFTVDSSLLLETEFDYDSSPFGEELDEDMRDVLRHDQELFPRDPDHLPRWHPDAH